jgi:molybdate transport system substrate-binding protein
MLLLFFTATIVLTGCGGSKEPAAGANSGQAQAKEEPPAAKAELTISAAASLTDSLKEVQKRFEAKHPGIRIYFNFGASGALQQQIEQGAPTDLFLPAAAKNMKALVDQGLIDADQQTNLLTNELVLVVPADGMSSVGGLEDLTKPDVRHIAVGEPETVPAGSYAKEALTNAKLWDALQSKFVLAKDVRQVLTYVESGNAEAGFVYKTDALTSKKVKVVRSIDTKLYKPIQYPAGIVKATKHGKEAKQFYDFLQSKEAQDVFVKYGFSASE